MHTYIHTHMHTYIQTFRDLESGVIGLIDMFLAEDFMFGKEEESMTV